MSAALKLKIDYVDHKAATLACLNWHYSKTVPFGKSVKVGAWENDRFIGVVIYSYGANNNAPKSFGVKQTEICELTRVALNRHETPVSRILSISRKLLKEKCPGLRLIFSYADKTNRGHVGAIYQADNWIYLGERTTGSKGAYYYIRGKKVHGRAARMKYGSERQFPRGWTHAPSETKHLYVNILDTSYVLKHEAKPYPKNAVEGEASTRPDTIGEKDGSSPIQPLHREVNNA